MLNFETMGKRNLKKITRKLLKLYLNFAKLMKFEVSLEKKLKIVFLLKFNCTKHLKIKLIETLSLKKIQRAKFKKVVK
jgi:hypothetical protein